MKLETIEMPCFMFHAKCFMNKIALYKYFGKNNGDYKKAFARRVLRYGERVLRGRCEIDTILVVFYL